MDEFEKWLIESIQTIKNAEHGSFGDNKTILRDRVYIMNMVLEQFQKYKRELIK